MCALKYTASFANMFSGGRPGQGKLTKEVNVPVK